MREIGRRLGVSRAAPYRHFPDKAALLVAVAATGFQRLSGRLQSIDAGAQRPSVERFRRMGEEYVRFALENPAHYRLMSIRSRLSRAAAASGAWSGAVAIQRNLSGNSCAKLDRESLREAARSLFNSASKE